MEFLCFNVRAKQFGIRVSIHTERMVAERGLTDSCFARYVIRNMVVVSGCKDK